MGIQLIPVPATTALRAEPAASDLLWSLSNPPLPPLDVDALFEAIDGDEGEEWKRGSK